MTIEDQRMTKLPATVASGWQCSCSGSEMVLMKHACYGLFILIIRNKSWTLSYRNRCGIGCGAECLRASIRSRTCGMNRERICMPSFVPHRIAVSDCHSSKDHGLLVSFSRPSERKCVVSPLVTCPLLRCTRRFSSRLFMHDV